MNSKIFLVVLIIALLIVSFVAGFFTNKLLSNSGSITSAQNLSNPIFASQLATINGKITRIQGKMLSISGDNGGNINVEAGEGISINKNTNGIPSVSTDIKKIELNKSSVISLVANKGKYVVTSVYLPSLPQNVSSEPLKATSSAKPIDVNAATSSAGPPLIVNPL